ncbi:MAG TPA: hypothetical protein VKQ54_03480 [Caulobacteraceae bacterium]|nr:hypothetical protein [Caulobacteraceae bacterium]
MTVGATPIPPPFPIIVGVAGHRDLLPGTEEALRASVRGVLAGLQAKFGDALHLLTSLADGADQLVADVAEGLGGHGKSAARIKLIAVSPGPHAEYRARMWDRDRFDHHWARADLRLELPNLQNPESLARDDLRYEQLGVLISRRSHLLLALWNGHPGDASPKVRRGGAAAVVRMRQEGEDTLPAFRHSPLFPDSVSRLDLSQGGPIVHIVTPRQRGHGSVLPAGAKAGDYFVPPAPDQDSRQDKPPAAPKRVDPSEVFAGLGEGARQDLAQMLLLNSRIGRFHGLCLRLYARQLGFLVPKGVADPAGEPGDLLRRLRQWQAAADTAAQFFQRRLMGELAPAESFGRMCAKGWEAMIEARRPPMPGIVFAYAALVPAAVLLFETYAHLWRRPEVLALYLGVFAIGALYYWLRLRQFQLQNRFQDYRALAEAMRVQLFWAAAARPEAAADSYLRKQSGEMGWIQFALRGPALWSTAAALGLGSPQRELVMKGWIDDQIRFFGLPRRADGKPVKGREGKAILYGDAARRARVLAAFSLALGLAVSVFLVAIGVFGPLNNWVDRAAEGLLPGATEARDWLVVAAAAAPALAAFFSLWVEFRAYEAQAQSYALMGRVFDRAKRIAEAAGDDDEAFQAVIRDLGREALAENAEWLVDHRRRKIEQRAS